MKITLNSHEYDIETDENGRTVCENFTGYIHDIIQELQLAYPRLFPEKPAEKLPLAIGIDKGLGVYGVPSCDLKIALGYWCKGVRYRRAIQMGRKFNMRFYVSRYGDLEVTKFNERVYE